MKVLITCGPTWVPIDQVRVISNVSSGQVGHLIAQRFLDLGAEVTLIEGAVTDFWEHPKVTKVRYKFFDELEASLKVLLKKKFDCVIHAAAVSDFKVKNTARGKINSNKALRLDLVPTQKLIGLIKELSPEACLVGFKLEERFSATNAFDVSRDLFLKAGCDLVVANSLKPYKAFLVDADGNIVARADSKKTLANILVKTLL